MQSQDKHQTVRDVLVFALLIAIGVAGRWSQPEWCFTPIAAATVFAGFYFSRLAIAILVPVTILVVSDLILPAYDNVPVMLVTYAVMMVPAWLGQRLRSCSSGWGRAACATVCGFVPATLFFLATNFAVWAFQSDYEKTLAGLVQCYWAAVPFYRWMLAGDLFYLGVLFGCWAVALHGQRIRAHIAARVTDRS